MILLFKFRIVHGNLPTAGIAIILIVLALAGGICGALAHRRQNA